MQKFIWVILFSLLVSLNACTEDEPDTTVIATEQILYSSSEKLRILGRLITNQQIELIDHGFYISGDEVFSSPIIISLGSKVGPGRFIGETDGLTNSKTYYAKAFIDIDGEIQFGNVIQLETLTPTIKSFSPDFGTEGDDFILKGTNFTKDTQVFFGDTQATITSIVDESTIHLKIPPPIAVNVPIKLISQNVKLEFTSLFEYKTGTYELISNYPDHFRLAGSAYYSREGSLVIGLGNMSLFALYPRMKKFDIESSEWLDVTYNGSNRSYGFSTENFLGGGTLNLDTLGYKHNNTFFKITNNGFEPLEDLSFVSRESIAFEINEELYVIGSLDVDFFGVRKYNPKEKTWTRITSTPTMLSQTNPFFVYESKFYVVDSDKNLWEFEPNSISWRKVAVFPGDIGKGYGMGQVIGDKAYVGLYQRTTEIWELDMSDLSWKAKRNIPGSTAEVTVAHYSYGGYLYIMRTPDRIISGNFPMNLYKFDPNGF